MSFTCPHCGAVSHNPTDEAEGYCGRCHEWTAEPGGAGPDWDGLFAEIQAQEEIRRQRGTVKDTGQRFPAGALVELGHCDGLCERDELEIVHATVGPSFAQAVDRHFCAECLADMVEGAPAVGGHVYAACTDGLYREVCSSSARRRVEELMPGFYDVGGELHVDVRAVLRSQGIPVTPETVEEATENLTAALRQQAPDAIVDVDEGPF